MKRKRTTAVLLTVILTAAAMLAPAVPLAADAPWTTVTVDSSGDVGEYTSLAFDSSNNPRIGYYDYTNGFLKYESWNGSSWDKATVDSSGDVGGFISLALDSSNSPRISYYDATNACLKYASWNGSSWDRETVDSTASVGLFTSLALDASGDPRISYYDATNGYLKYASWNGSSWDRETVDSSANVGYYTSLALDASGDPRISYLDVTNSNLEYTSWNGSSWDTETVDSSGDVGGFISLALGSSGNPRISYYDNTNGYLKYTSWNGSSWDTETVDNNGNVGQYTSLALDSSTWHPRISYRDVTNDDLKFASWDGSSWDKVTVDSVGNVGEYDSLALDSAGDPGISYYDLSNGGLKYAYLYAIPIMNSSAATNVTQTQAILNGEITATGAENADQRGFLYRKAGTGTWTQWIQNGSFGAGAFNHQLTGLEPDTGYEYQAMAHNSKGWGYGTTVSFTTESPIPTNWYLAEGSTAWGFSAYISIENPNSSEVAVDLTYNTPDGPVSGGTLCLSPMSQTTINPAETLGEKDFSTLITAPDGETIAVDRTMQWTGEGASAPAAHNSIGVTSPAQTWYLPEGSTNWGFETWLLIQNPNASDANCTVTYMIEGQGPVIKYKKVPANSRESYDMEDDIGVYDASIKVESDQPVIPERAMYRNNRREGHDSIGTTTPAVDYYMAEGAVGYSSGYTTYILIQNPQSQANLVTVTYLTGSGEVAGPTVEMPPNSRHTVRVNDQLPLNTDVSTTVHGDNPIIAERAMYWNSPAGEACHDSIGMSEPHTTFYLPDGQTSDGRETWTLVANPNDSDVSVRISYLTKTGTGNVSFEETVPANSRKTYNMAEEGITGRASVLVQCLTSGNKIMCERAMYWFSRAAGTDTIGGFSD